MGLLEALQRQLQPSSSSAMGLYKLPGTATILIAAAAAVAVQAQAGTVL